MKNTFSITGAMSRLNISIEDAEGVLSREAARQIAFALDLPVSGLPEDTSPSSFYDNEHAPKVEAMLGEVNEQSACDFDCAKEACKVYWLSRYDAMHNPESAFADIVQQQCDPTIVEIVSPVGQPISSLESLAEQVDIRELRSAVKQFLSKGAR